MITVEGESIQYAAPDEVILTLNIEKKADQLSDARKQVEAISQKVIDFLMSQGIEKRFIQTKQFTVRRNYDYNKKMNVGFVASHNLHVCINELEKFSQISDELLLMDINSLGNPVFRSSNLESIKDKARIEAIRKAKEKAKMLAAELDLKIGKAIKISERSADSVFNTGSYSLGTATDNVNAEAAEGFAPGQIEVRATIEVSFLLEE